MTAGPPLQNSKDAPPEAPKRAPPHLVYWAVANAGWLLAWPIVFITLLSHAAMDGKIAHWISVGGFTLWIASMFSFYGFLRALEEYSTALKFFVRGLEFVFNVLLFFAPIG